MLSNPFILPVRRRYLRTLLLYLLECEKHILMKLDNPGGKNE